MTNNNINSQNSDSISLSQTVNYLNLELNRLQKAYEKLKGNKPNKTEAQQNVDMHFTEVMRLLRKQAIRTAIEKTLADYPGETSEVREFLEPRPSDFIEDEIKSVSPIKFDEKELFKAITSALKQENLTLPYTTVDDFYRIIEEAHQQILDNIEESRRIAKRKRIKRMHRVVEGSTSITAGVALCAGNATSSTVAIAILASVLLGLNRVSSGYNKIAESPT